jgi:hypothetical protein
MGRSEADGHGNKTGVGEQGGAEDGGEGDNGGGSPGCFVAK